MTGNDNNLITDNQVRDVSTGGTAPLQLVASRGSSAALVNSNNTISNNELFNFNSNGVGISSTGNESWTVSGNNIYEASVQSSALTGITFGGSGVNVVTGNFVHDLLTTFFACEGILFDGGGVTTISRNRIALTNVNAATTSLDGIHSLANSGSLLTVLNNEIMIAPATSVSATIHGLLDSGSVSGSCNVFFNTILIGGTATGSSSTWACLRTSANMHTARNNILFNSRTGGTGSHFAGGIEATGGSYSSDYNVFAGTGAATASFMDFGTVAFTPVPATFAGWQSATGGDAHSSGGNPGGNFSSAMFVDPANGDLHLVPGGNVLVNNTGTPLAGVTTDYDGQLRSATLPFIGADELVSSNADLTGITLSAGGLSPVFAASTLSYTASVSNSTGTLTFTPTLSSGVASVMVNGGSAATPVTLSVGGGNVLSIVSTATDGTMKTYTVTVTRRTVFQDWAVANGNASDPLAIGANGAANLLNFGFGVDPNSGAGGALVFNGSFGAGGSVGATGQPRTVIEGAEVRALFVRRKDFAAAGLVYGVEFTGGLTSWQASVDTPTVLADDGTNQIVSVPFPASTGAMGFFRVRVTLGP